MDLPSWRQSEEDKEREYRELLRKQGERESFQRSVNFLEGDHLGLEDGRPGVGFGLGVDGPVLTMPLEWRLALWIGGAVIVCLLAFGTRACIGEERAQQILHNQPAAEQTSTPGN